MVVVKKKEIGDVLLIEAYGELHQVEDTLKYFRAKYQQDFESFSERMRKEDENFEYFDDYVEWKAYEKLYQETTAKIEDLKSGNFQVTQ